MRLSEIQNKDIISIIDGKKIGNIIDIKIDVSTGMITRLILENKGIMNRFISGQNETEITWSQITKIGEDVILVNMN